MQPKLKLLRVLDILNETDETHPITAVGITLKLKEMNISAERKSVCRDINTLIEYGYEIVLCHDNKLGYYMKGEKKSTPAVSHRPVTTDLIEVTIEYKSEDADTVYDIIGKGNEEVNGDYITANIHLPSSELFPTLLRLGVKAKLIEPAYLKEDFEKTLSEISDFYKKRRDNAKMDVWLL